MVSSMMSHQGNVNDVSARKKQPRGRSHKTLQKVLSELPNVPERVILNYSLTKTENESFGVTIVGGIGTMVQDIYIKSVSKNGVCGINDTLKVGDQVLIINGRQLKNVTHQEAVNCFRECKTKIDIMVSRMIESKPQKEHNRLSPFHGRIISSSSDSWGEEPIILEHKIIEASITKPVNKKTEENFWGICDV